MEHWFRMKENSENSLDFEQNEIQFSRIAQGVSSEYYVNEKSQRSKLDYKIKDHKRQGQLTHEMKRSEDQIKDFENKKLSKKRPQGSHTKSDKKLKFRIV